MLGQVLPSQWHNPFKVYGSVRYRNILTWGPPCWAQMPHYRWRPAWMFIIHTHLRVEKYHGVPIFLVQWVFVIHVLTWGPRAELKCRVTDGDEPGPPAGQQRGPGVPALTWPHHKHRRHHACHGCPTQDSSGLSPPSVNPTKLQQENHSSAASAANPYKQWTIDSKLKVTS
jgi:hypothetical protein